jgi:hypothetical protein
MSSSPSRIKLLSIDIGIKNLAFCLFEIENNIYSVKKWDIVNIGEETPLFCGEIENEKSKTKSTTKKQIPQQPQSQSHQSSSQLSSQIINICNKPAKYTKNNKCYCLKHSKKQVFHVPTKELVPAYLNKQKINSLFELAEKYNISYTKPIKKQDLIHLFNEHVLNKCFEPVNITNSNKVDIISIGKNIKIKFDEIFTINGVYDNIDIILIENQISPIANRMKTIQGMVAQYFIMKSSAQSQSQPQTQSQQQHIEFVSSFNKLKEVSKTPFVQDDKTEKPEKSEKNDKAKYNDRKKLGISTCLENLEKTHINDEWVKFFNKHSKKDDLADCFLQGIWYIKNRL